ncbi:hypothetical protein [Streptomyces sp. CA-111067]|uniref:hypothetical protein n=1 Tax=Streptomyces sp. CA-111067 TaxID=3240046 RepID=UPI003D952E14
MLDTEGLRTLGWRGGDGNAAYLDKTLLHGGMEISLDDRVSARAIGILAIYALAASVLSFVPFFFLGLVLLVVGGASVFYALLVIGWIVSAVVFWVVLLGAKVPEPISEWRVLLDARTEHAESVYSKISGTLAHRGIPLNVTRRRIRTGLRPDQVSNRLVINDGPYVAYISVFRYGSSLYLGWMMWRSRRGFGLIKQYVSDLVLSITGRADTELLMLRTERPRAMREAVHAACREGLVVAIDQTLVPLDFGFPMGLPPIETRGSGQGGFSGADLPSTAFPIPPRHPQGQTQSQAPHQPPQEQPQAPRHQAPQGQPQGQPQPPVHQAPAHSRQPEAAPAADLTDVTTPFPVQPPVSLDGSTPPPAGHPPYGEEPLRP